MESPPQQTRETKMFPVNHVTYFSDMISNMGAIAIFLDKVRTQDHTLLGQLS